MKQFPCPDCGASRASLEAMCSKCGWTPVSVAAPGSPSADRLSPWRLASSGAWWSVIFTFPITAITALLFRFPVPFTGYVSGFKAVFPAMIALLFYGVLFGGFILLVVLGGIGGFVVGVTLKNDQRQSRFATRMWALFISSVGVLALAVLDKIIGPW